MPIYMVPNPDDMQAGQPGHAPTPQGPSPHAAVDYFVKAEGHPGGANLEGFSWGESNPAAAGPGAGPHAQIIGPEHERPNPTGDGTRRDGGALGILIGLLRFSLVAILIGLLLPTMFFLFAPAGMAGEAGNLLTGGQMCSGDPDVNGDGSEAMVSSYSQPVHGILIGLNQFRVGMGNLAFIDFCKAPASARQPDAPPPPPPGAPNASSTDEPQPTATTANSNANVTTNNNPNGTTEPTQPPVDACAQVDSTTAWVNPNFCSCQGITYTVTQCVNGQPILVPNANTTCTPDPAQCQQPPGDGGQQPPPPPPACEYKCYVTDPNKPEQCMQGGWVYPGTDNACDPNKP